MEARVSRGLFALGIVGSASALGAIHTPVLLATAAIFGASAFFGWRSENPSRVRSMATLLVALGVALTAYTALQAIPLPRGLVAALSPYAAEVWDRSLRPVGLAGPAWITLSLDPVATRIQVLRGATYLACLLAALPIARSREGATFLERLLIGSVLFVGVAAILHPLVGAERVFGIYQPIAGSGGRHIAPLLNPNNLAAYVNIGLCMALGVAVSADARPPTSRWIAGGIALFFVALEVWIASRGGVGSMLLGVVLVAVLASRMRAHGSATKGLLVAVLAAVVAASFGMLVVGGSDEAWTELADSDVSKLQIFGHAMRMVARAPVFGVGRGAFASSFPAFRSDNAGNVTFREPENILAQWPCEWGVPVAVAALVVFAVVFRPSTPLARSRPPVGAWAALLCLFVHNLVDFDSEVPGVVVALVTAGALVVGGSAGHRERFRLRRWSRRPGLVGGREPGRAGGGDGGGVPRGRPRPRGGQDAPARARARRARGPARPRCGDCRCDAPAPRRALLSVPRRAAGAGGARRVTAPLARRRASTARASTAARTCSWRARSGAARRRRPGSSTGSPTSRTETSRSRRRPRADGSCRPTRMRASWRRAMTSRRRTCSRRWRRASVRACRRPRRVSTRISRRSAGGSAPRATPVARASGAGRGGRSRGRERLVVAPGRDACVVRATAALARLRAQSPDRCHTDALEAQLQLAMGQSAPALETLEKAVRTDHDGLDCVDLLVSLAERQSTDGHADALLERIASLACSSGSACVETLSALSRPSRPTDDRAARSPSPSGPTSAIRATPRSSPSRGWPRPPGCTPRPSRTSAASPSAIPTTRSGPRRRMRSAWRPTASCRR